MPNEIITVIIVLFALVLIILLPSFKIVKEDEVMFIERFGKFHKMLDQPGIYFIIPLIDRNIETVPLKEFQVEKKLKYKDNDDYKTIEVRYDMQVFDPKTFVYGSLDSKETIHQYIIDSVINDIDYHDIIEETIDYAKTYGFNIRNLNIK
jgi:regulator of protease activity HflC (stomatin/prohibitin superfamily)